MPDYYALTSKGKAWIENEAPDPTKYQRVLAALVELITENDVPRTAEQVAHTANITPTSSATGLKYLVSKGYTKPDRPPQPSARGETPKIRLRPIEDLAAAEARAEVARTRYALGPKGRQAHSRYEHGEKGRAKNVKYWSDPDKGRKVQKKYRLRRRLSELTAHLKKHPELESLIQPDINKAQRQLAELGGE